MTANPRILIATAAFGDGHNSAARNLALALEAAGSEVRVVDPCMAGAPGCTTLLNRAYRIVTTRFPRLWARIYQSTDRCDFSRQWSPLMRPPERALASMVREFQPHAVVSTYPLYPYFMARGGNTLPVITVVTDSMQINAAWLRAPSHRWMVTDPETRATMIRQGVDAQAVIDTGFPVHPVFPQLAPVGGDDPCDPFRILYFPTAGRSQLRPVAGALLDGAPSVRLTIVMGRNVRRLYHEARKISNAHPGRVRLIGWTRRIPELLCSHHLAVGKAGGATVHEAIAAHCPMIIHHLVPGQEEGNLQLLESIGAGLLAQSPELISRQLREMLAARAAGWRMMKTALARHDRRAGSATAASFILDHLATSGPSSPRHP